MTQLTTLVAYGGEIPSLIDATDEYEYAISVENYLSWWDTTNTPQLEGFRSQLNTLSGEIQQVADDTVVVYNNTLSLKDDVTVMKDIVLDASNYEGDWSDKSYPSGASVSYFDEIYYSKLDDNTAEPTLLQSDDNWFFAGRKDFVYVDVSADYTANVKDFCKVDTTNGVISITLPATPSNNDIIGFIDIKGMFDTNNLTILQNGNLIMGADDVLTASTKNMSFKLIYNNGDWRLI